MVSVGSVGFDYEDRLQKLRDEVDDNRDGSLSDQELASVKPATPENPNPQVQSQGDKPGDKLSAFTIPGQTKTADTDKAQRVIADLKAGAGVTRSETDPSKTGTRSGKLTEMNVNDQSNYQRMRAAGLTDGQLTNKENIFMHLGQDQDGNHRYGFYSRGHGDGDERAGVITVKPGESIASLGANAWTNADLSNGDGKAMKDALEARDNLVKKQYGGDFEKYSESMKLKSQIQDLMGAHGAANPTTRTRLGQINSLLNNGDNLENAKEQFNKLLEDNKDLQKSLFDTRLAEARGRVSDKDFEEISGAAGQDQANYAELNKSLDAALAKTSDERNKLDEAKEKELETQSAKFLKSLEGIDPSKITDPTQKAKLEAFINARDASFNKSENGQYSLKPDAQAQKLTEMKWQNARFDKAMKDADFKAAIEQAKQKAETKPETTPPSENSPPATNPPQSRPPEAPRPNESTPADSKNINSDAKYGFSIDPNLSGNIKQVAEQNQERIKALKNGESFKVGNIEFSRLGEGEKAQYFYDTAADGYAGNLADNRESYILEKGDSGKLEQATMVNPFLHGWGSNNEYGLVSNDGKVYTESEDKDGQKYQLAEPLKEGEYKGTYELQDNFKFNTQHFAFGPNGNLDVVKVKDGTMSWGKTEWSTEGSLLGSNYSGPEYRHTDENGRNYFYDNNKNLVGMSFDAKDGYQAGEAVDPTKVTLTKVADDLKQDYEKEFNDFKTYVNGLPISESYKESLLQMVSLEGTSKDQLGAGKLQETRDNIKSLKSNVEEINSHDLSDQEAKKYDEELKKLQGNIEELSKRLTDNKEFENLNNDLKDLTKSLKELNDLTERSRLSLGDLNEVKNKYEQLVGSNYEKLKEKNIDLEGIPDPKTFSYGLENYYQKDGLTLEKELMDTLDDNIRDQLGLSKGIGIYFEGTDSGSVIRTNDSGQKYLQFSDEDGLTIRADLNGDQLSNLQYQNSDGAFQSVPEGKNITEIQNEHSKHISSLITSGTYKTENGQSTVSKDGVAYKINYDPENKYSLSLTNDRGVEYKIHDSSLVREVGLKISPPADTTPEGASS